MSKFISDLIHDLAMEKSKKSKVWHVYHTYNLEVMHTLETKKDISKYQSYQSSTDKRLGEKDDISVAWVKIEKDENKYVYAGIYKNTQNDIVEGGKGRDYKCKKILNAYDCLIGKLVIHLKEMVGRNFIKVKKIDVINEHIQNSIGTYPGHNKVILSFSELKSAILNPDYKNNWSNVRAVYRWVNKKNGKMYIGSAYGENGLLQRMEAYANKSHGNTILQEANLEDMHFSIIYAQDKDYITKNEILEKEYREIEKTMSYKHGYNSGTLKDNEDRINKLKEQKEFG